MNYWAFFIEALIYTVYVAASTGFGVRFFRCRQKFLIRHRLPELTLLSNGLLVFAGGMILWKEAAFFFGFSFPWWVSVVVLHCGLFGIGEFLVVRGYYTYSIYYLQKAAKEVSTSQKELDESLLPKKERFKVAFVNKRVRQKLIFAVLFAHTGFIAGQIWLQREKTGFFLIGEEWKFLVLHATGTFLLLSFFVTKLLRVEESLNLIKEFAVSQANLCIFLLFILPALLWAILELDKDPTRIHATFFFGVEFFYVPFLLTTHMLATLVWPVYLQISAEKQTWNNADVCDEVSMDAFLQNAGNLQRLRAIAEKLFCVELIEFWEAVHTYKQTILPQEAERLKGLIVRRFVATGSVYEVNVSAVVRKEVITAETRADPEKDLFNKANDQVLRLILENVYNGLLAENVEEK